MNNTFGIGKDQILKDWTELKECAFLQGWIEAPNNHQADACVCVCGGCAIAHKVQRDEKLGFPKKLCWCT